MGAVFSGGGAVVSYDDGVQAAASGTTGTQRNEFEAAIKSVTSSTTVGAVFLYDTSQDSDGGKWRSKCKGLSWFDEPTLPAGTGANQWNSATRSARSEFPAMALIVADTAVGVTVYDLDDPAAPMFMVFDSTSSANDLIRNAGVGSAFALNGRIYFGLNSDNGFVVADLVSDTGSLYTQSAGSGGYKGTIATRNEASGFNLGSYGVSIVNNTVNDVSATIIEGSELGALGLPIPTVAVACNADGISVIHPNGDVYDQKKSSYASIKCAFDADNSLFGLYETGTARSVSRFLLGQLYSDTTAGNDEYVINLTSSGWSSAGMALGQSQDAFSFAGKNKFALGGTSGLHLWKRAVGFDALNTAEPPNLNAHITSDYNTGYMVGDIRLALPAVSGPSYYSDGNTVPDRSVKGNDLACTGQVDLAVVATSAEMPAFTGFSANDYLSKAYTADFNFSTTDFSIMFWVKFSGTGVYDTILERAYYNGSAYSGNGFYIETGGSNSITFKSDTGGVTIAGDSSTNWQQIVFARRGSTVYGYRNGALSVSGTDARDFDNTSATLRVGGRLNGTGPADGSSLSLLRISKTAPTPKQIADIYAAEKPLFAAGASCLLQSDAYTNVTNLAYDKSTDLLHVTQTANSNGESVFRGLECVDTFSGDAHGWDSASVAHVSAAGGVKARARTSGTGGVILDLPALDVRAELLEGEDKLPDDGKLHFEGVTTNATPTVIGFIPIAEGETYYINSKVTGFRYGQPDTSWRLCGEIKQQFTRTYHGNVVAESESFKLSEGEQASMDIELVTTTGGSDVPASIAASDNFIMLKVTGSGSYRVQWKASVEVQRISEKTYER